MAAMIDATISPRGVRIVVVLVHRRTDSHANSKGKKTDRDGRAGADAGTRLSGRCGRHGRGLCNNDRCGSRCVVDGHGIVLRNVDDLWIGRLDLHVWLTVIGLLRVDRHLRTGLQVARLLRLCALPLDGVHHALLVCLKVLSKLACPIDLLAHVVYDLREAHEVLHAGAEASLLCSIGDSVALEILVLEEPVTAVEHLLCVGRSRQNLREQLIRIESDRGYEIVDAYLQGGRTRGSALCRSSTLGCSLRGIRARSWIGVSRLATGHNIHG